MIDGRLLERGLCTMRPIRSRGQFPGMNDQAKELFRP
jgi:hypothetical protein